MVPQGNVGDMPRLLEVVAEVATYEIPGGQVSTMRGRETPVLMGLEPSFSHFCLAGGCPWLRNSTSHSPGLRDAAARRNCDVAARHSAAAHDARGDAPAQRRRAGHPCDGRRVSPGGVPPEAAGDRCARSYRVRVGPGVWRPADGTSQARPSDEHGPSRRGRIRKVENRMV